MSGSAEIDLKLRPGKDRLVRQGHPWVFSGAIANLSPKIDPGSQARVFAASGELLGSGYVNPACTIAVRLLTRGEEAVDRALVDRRVAAAVGLRRRLIGPDTNTFRLINGEGDGFPGFVVDRFDDVLVLQCLTAGADRLREWLIDSLVEHCRPRAIVESSRGAVRRAEGLADRSEPLRGTAPGEMAVLENGVRMLVEPGGGQKTGYFCDQRDNRALLSSLARDRSVLDCFCYSGAFAVHAGVGGAARVVAIDSSEPALELARRNWSGNGLVPQCAAFDRGRVVEILRQPGDLFDIIVLDPPALAKRRADLRRGARAYRDLHVAALSRIVPGGLLLTFTCSQHVDGELFRKIVANAASDAGRHVRILRRLGPGCDHPVLPAHPEADYLRGFLLQVE